jgi:hypothetical protein
MAAGLAAVVLALTPALSLPVGSRPASVDVALPMEWPDNPPRPEPPPPMTPGPLPLGPGCPTCWN